MKPKKESSKVLNHPLFQELIVMYQSSLKKRYSDENLKLYPEFSSIPRSKIDQLLHFFLEYLYPEYSKRKELDAAFDALSGFVNHPTKIWGILGNLALSIFRFGKHFPMALKAGLAALQSYVTAHQFEEELVMELDRQENQIGLLGSEFAMETLIAKVEKKKADAFRKDIGGLFKVFSDAELIRKIILIMEDILLKMESKGTVYTEEDRKGISLGVSILKEGREIFDEMKNEEITLVLQAIDRIEEDFYLKACTRGSN
ncbi:hypothetical protein [Leptospira kanakyensis]|uniref:Uncharacterized protein n=1 Tax=Leptospira kanakyensis TaxID=2484968 RepID=A0A6N4QBQ2_9LEPT|nr:hypothetical protein [Leptospira kanakyensis]MCW7470364.1 hypothetical protein [Leptospira kanakyensis]TGK53998.1 hypothetical protein EHQ11_06695 [Leptospira kanakyensis]TGK57793.1 hypothetical protein EHQ16_18385 [Leptospira kanakyensis]TGK73502.1 hypothetical protein EHQ18_06770 [Leptospira kanakyensis]